MFLSELRYVALEIRVM